MEIMKYTHTNVEFRLPQNSATVCFINKESSGGMTKLVIPPDDSLLMKCSADTIMFMIIL
jgi:hypothetical protein